MANQYPEDEFDRLALDRKVVGAHREPESNRSWWLAGLAVLVLAPLLGWAFVHFGGADSASGPTWPTDPATTAEATASPTDEATEDASSPASEDASEAASAEASEDASPSASASASDDADSDDSDSDSDSEDSESAGLATEVRVLNGSRVNGLAATKQQALAGAGFTNVVASNYQGGSSPQYSTVYYAQESDSDAAAKVGETLGISNVVYSPQSVVGGEGIVVVLRSDAAN